ncbi:MAG: peptidoglycan-associated lipoprotein Pal [Bdellovibrionota bacterium]
MITKKNWVLWTMTLSFGAMMTISCSKKQTTEEPDSSGDISSIDTGDGSGYGAAGQKIAALPTIYFEYDSFSLNSASREALGLAAQWLIANTAQRIQIEGHCDERGTTEYNLALGERRASTVRDFLVSKGVSSSQVSTISYGEERPLAMGSDEAAWAKNRRVEFVTGF